MSVVYMNDILQWSGVGFRRALFQNPCLEFPVSIELVFPIQIPDNSGKELPTEYRHQRRITFENLLGTDIYQFYWGYT